MIALRTDPTPGYVLRIHVGTQTRASRTCHNIVRLYSDGLIRNGLFRKSEIRNGVRTRSDR